MWSALGCNCGLPPHGFPPFFSNISLRCVCTRGTFLIQYFFETASKRNLVCFFLANPHFICEKKCFLCFPRPLFPLSPFCDFFSSPLKVAILRFTYRKNYLLGVIQGVRRTHGQPTGEPRRTVSGYIKICGAPSGEPRRIRLGDHTITYISISRKLPLSTNFAFSPYVFRCCFFFVCFFY